MRTPLRTVLVAFALAACTSFSERELPAPSHRDPAPGVGTEALIPGRAYSIELTPEVAAVETDGRLFVSAPVDSRARASGVLIGYPTSGAWRPLTQPVPIADVRQIAIRGKSLALLEHRGTGEGGYSEDVVLVDTRTGRRELIDSYTLSPATYRGGGGPPRRPVGRLAFGGDVIAWTRLIEQPGGEIVGELRVQRIGELDSRAVRRSAHWVTAEAIDQGRVVYITAGADQDELHMYEIANGHDSVAARSPHIFDAALSGRWLLYARAGETREGGEVGPSAIVLRDLEHGGERILRESVGRECPETSLNERFAAWNCWLPGAPSVLSAFDLTAQSMRDVVKPVQVGVVAEALQAVPGGLHWIERTGAKRYLRLLTFEGTVLAEGRDRLRLCVDVSRVELSARPTLVAAGRQAFALIESEPIYAQAGFAGAPFVVDEGCPSPPVLLESGERHPKVGGERFVIARVDEPSVYRLFVYLVPESDVIRMFGRDTLLWRRYAHENICVPWPGHGQECLEVTTELYVSPSEAADVGRLRERLAEALGLRQPPY